jgi:hypothetical protein
MLRQLPWLICINRGSYVKLIAMVNRLTEAVRVTDSVKPRLTMTFWLRQLQKPPWLTQNARHG